MQGESLLLLLLLLCPTVNGQCKYVEVVKCFIEMLEEWAWTLYNSKDNVVTIDKDEGCNQFEEIGKCIKDEKPDKHMCSAEQVLEASRTVSDLLTHRKKSGTFLKSYYLLQFACTDGMKEIEANRECLKQEHIGESTLAAASYFEDKIKAKTNGNAVTDPVAVCKLITERLTTFRDALGEDLCDGSAAHLMCESLWRMFKNVEPKLMEGCTYDCKQSTTNPEEEEETPEEVPPVEKVGQEGGTAEKKVDDQDGNNGAPRFWVNLSVLAVGLSLALITG